MFSSSEANTVSGVPTALFFLANKLLFCFRDPLHGAQHSGQVPPQHQKLNLNECKWWLCGTVSDTSAGHTVLQFDTGARCYGFFVDRAQDCQISCDAGDGPPNE